MKYGSRKHRWAGWLVGLGVLAGACQNDNYIIDPLPTAIVNEQIVLTDPRYVRLQLDGGYVELDRGGLKGLIIYRVSNGKFRAFERQCTWQPTDTCSQVMVDPSGQFMIDTCCGSQFDFEGRVTAPPAVSPLRQYAAVVSSNVLYISN
ncbi:Rieske [2Fe-2S] domain-containing protein [Catalinimonas alkaloidigena]|uniref:Rieske [2Fe-2S] domain-containing protein n=1 Tax=Catalinimonas alkaloidigena TaxID=1075417 RepID=A0A1G9NGS3_9BACT|nr:Rieske 2Fe-2S domain-containing protein [Catalinimonas alkaloidigena]SDL85105.1 Rieske [2Fe-2S] domain-containing protein [Catalinimonas alkaloidigena]